MRYSVLLLLLVLVGCSQNTGSVLDSISPLDDAVTAPIAAPDFSLKSLDGKTYSLKALRGKWVIVNFWATWCVPCRSEMPDFQSFYEDYSEQVEILAVNNNEEADVVADFRDEFGLTFPLLLDPSQITLSQYKVLGLPITLIVDPKGLIVWDHLGGLKMDEFETTITDFMKSYSQ